MFDVLHYGHVLYIEEAKKYCDYLIVSVTSDKFVNKGPNRPIFNLSQRLKVIANLICVDAVIVNNKPNAVDIISKIRPNFYIKGKDYLNLKSDITGNIIKEKKAVEKFNGKILFTKSKLYSSSQIINENFEFFDEGVKSFLKKINKEKTKTKIQNNFKNNLNKKVLLIGEPIIDNYTFVSFLGKSSKSNIISTQYKNENVISGGTFLVANTLSNFLKNVQFICPTNKKLNNIYKSNLNKNIKKINVNLKDYKLINKKRFVDNYTRQKLFQINTNDNSNLSDKNEKILISMINKSIKKNNFESIVIFDYGHGFISQNLLNKINFNKKKDIFVNCQTNASNFGFNTIDKYGKNINVCVDELEFRLLFKDKSKKTIELINKNKKIISQYKSFIVTMGKNGCYIIKKNEIKFIPTVFKKLDNTIGCGDVFFSAAIVSFLLKKFSLEEMGLISHIMAGMHANHGYNPKQITKEQLIKTCNSILS